MLKATGDTQSFPHSISNSSSPLLLFPLSSTSFYFLLPSLQFFLCSLPPLSQKSCSPSECRSTPAEQMALAAAAQEQRQMLGTSSHRMMDMGSPQLQGGMGEAGCCSPAQGLHSAGQGMGPAMVVLGERVAVAQLLK